MSFDLDRALSHLGGAVVDFQSEVAFSVEQILLAEKAGDGEFVEAASRLLHLRALGLPDEEIDQGHPGLGEGLKGEKGGGANAACIDREQRRSDEGDDPARLSG